MLLEVAADNPRAIELYRRIGFQTEGVLRRQLVRPEGAVDVLVMAYFLEDAMIVAINQPCYLPWRGFFALMKAADVFVFYDDVQFTSNTSRSFFARVQLKTAGGRRWLSVPVRKSGRFGQRIDETEILDDGWAGAPLRGHPGGVPGCPLRRPDRAAAGHARPDVRGRGWRI